MICSRNALGQNHLREQSFRAPLHLSKPHEDADALVVNVVTQTAGIFDDDEVELNARVEPGSHLVLTTPAASRVYRSRNGDAAVFKQHFHVADNASLEFYPEPFIPHLGARYHQQNVLHVAPGGGLLFFEWLAPGRVASGEVFRYRELKWETDVWLGDTLVARERYLLNPENQSLAGLRIQHDQAHYLGCFVIGSFEFPNAQVAALGGEAVTIGSGPLCQPNCFVIKVLCADALATRRTLASLRSILYEAMNRAAPTLGRY